MTIASREYTNLGKKASYNKTLRHIVHVTSIIEAVDGGANLADILNNMVEAEQIEREQIAPILSLVLIQKFEFPFKSLNLIKTVTDFKEITETFKKWNGVDMIAAYFHQKLGLIPVNPANPEHWGLVLELKKDELLILYARTKNRNPDTARKAIDAFQKLIMGEKPDADPSFIDTQKKEVRPVIKAASPAIQPAPATAKPAAKLKKSLTPKYSVQVSNELFHNGNVEAWKNIIESYENKMKGCEVIVYHEGELIQDLNSLFKWGKVKHGGLIFFQVAGVNIKNVSRLKKYLYEGASKRYEAFMKHDVNRMLKLF